MERLKEYVEELFQEDNWKSVIIKTEHEYLPFTSEEISKAIETMTRAKTAGPDTIGIVNTGYGRTRHLNGPQHFLTKLLMNDIFQMI